jgi:hypothetical protein
MLRHQKWFELIEVAGYQLEPTQMGEWESFEESEGGKLS